MNGLALNDLYPFQFHATVTPYNVMTQRMDQFDPSLESEVTRRERLWRVQRGYPGGLSGAWCGTGRDPLLAKLSQLSPEMKREVVRRSIQWGVERGVADWISQAERGMGTLSQGALDSAITIAVQNALTPLMPVLKQQLLEIAEPAAKKASEVVGPVIEEKLREYGPTLAAITGVVAAVLSIVGMLLVGGYLKKQLG